MRNPRRKGGEHMNSYTLERQRKLAWSNLKKGGLSTKIARAFLKKHAAA